MLKGPLVISSCQAGAGNMPCCCLHPLARVSQSCPKVCLLEGTEEEEEGAKIVQTAGKADPQASKKSDKDTPEVRTPPVPFSKLV